VKVTETPPSSMREPLYANEQTKLNLYVEMMALDVKIRMRLRAWSRSSMGNFFLLNRPCLLMMCLTLSPVSVGGYECRFAEGLH
jgi:hypothetical protein